MLYLYKNPVLICLLCRPMCTCFINMMNNVCMFTCLINVMNKQNMCMMQNRHSDGLCICTLLGKANIAYQSHFHLQQMLPDEKIYTFITMRNESILNEVLHTHLLVNTYLPTYLFALHSSVHSSLHLIPAVLHSHLFVLTCPSTYLFALTFLHVLQFAILHIFLFVLMYLQFHIHTCLYLRTCSVTYTLICTYVPAHSCLASYVRYSFLNAQLQLFLIIFV